MSKVEKVLLTGKTHTTLSVAGTTARGLNIQLSSPGASKPAHEFNAIAPHPTAEQLFSGAWSACYIAAVELVAKEMKVALPEGLAVEIEVDLGQTGKEYFLQARLTARLPGLDPEVANALVHAADQVCPYSKATRGNIEVTLKAITE